MKNFQPGDYLILKDEFDRISSNWTIEIKRFSSLRKLIEWITKNSDWCIKEEAINKKQLTLDDLCLGLGDDSDTCEVYYLKITSKGIKKERIL